MWECVIEISRTPFFRHLVGAQLHIISIRYFSQVLLRETLLVRIVCMGWHRVGRDWSDLAAAAVLQGSIMYSILETGHSGSTATTASSLGREKPDYFSGLCFMG